MNETCGNKNCTKPLIHFWTEFNGNEKKSITVCINCGWRNEDVTVLEKATNDGAD